MKSRSSEILPLTGLRFFAALWVFVFHVGTRWSLDLPEPIQNIVRHGAAGMTLFFVLSGYVLAYNYSAQTINVAQYLRNRFARIYPVYALAAFITLPWFILQARADALSVGSVAGIVALNITMLQAWVPQIFPYWNDNASWSLSAEVFFYTAFLAIIPIIKIKQARTPLIFVIYFSAIAPGIIYLASDMSAEAGLHLFYAVPIFRIAEFAAGVVGFHFSKQLPVKYATIIVLFSTSSLLIYLSTPGLGDIFVTENFIVLPAIVAIVIGVAISVGRLNGFLSHPLALNLGRWSYCFYSFQAFILFIATEVQSRYPMPHLAVWAVSGVILLIMSWAGFNYVEEPARRWLKDRSQLSRRSLPIL